MDLIYMNREKEDVGVMKDYTLDLAFGADENDFECKVDSSNHCCREGFYLYIEGTEYGGVIDSVSVDKSDSSVTYKGRTWHGILGSKIIEPDSGQAYLYVSGDANDVISYMIERLGLSSLFVASSESSGITVKNFKFDRYTDGYKGITKMLKTSGAKIKVEFKNGMVELSAVPFIDYSKDEQFDSDKVDFRVSKKYNHINHVICLGKGELTEREVIHIYADASGNVSETQILKGIDEVSRTYDYSSAESSEELAKGGKDIIMEDWNSDEVSIDFNANDETYDIGDIVGATDNLTGIEVTAPITKKIVSVKNNQTTISYKAGE